MFLGWLKLYEFSDSDFSTALRLAEGIWQTNNSQILWKFLIGLCFEAIYGGRIDNSNDLVVLNSYLQQYFNDESLSHRWKPFKLNVSPPTSANYNVSF